MKTLNSPPKFLIYALSRAIIHPRTPIIYYYCSKCKLRFSSNEKECPKCHDGINKSPENRRVSPVPWWCSVFCIIIGIGAWIASACLKVPGLDEAARVLVYIPLGNLFGLSIKK